MSKANRMIPVALGAVVAACAATGTPDLKVSYEPYGAAPAAKAGTLADVDIPYEKHVLGNGLTVVLHEDHKAPVIAVAAWYHVGSKDEVPGKTGFAHLFEHLLFEGSENHPRHWDEELDAVGATDHNGTTWWDRTNYFETVPRTALDFALYMESERMGHFGAFLTRERLDVQRGVVQNEKRQRENQPYGKVYRLIQRASFPEGHPYRWETIGSMEDLNAASLKDVKAWFATYYGAANATLVLAGDLDPKATLAKVASYFGDIPSGPPVARRNAWVAPRLESTREEMQDRVAQVRIYQAWNTPPDRTEDSDLLDLFAQVLGGSAASRLDARLVHQDRLADRVSANNSGAELAGLFTVDADVKDGVDPALVEAILNEERERLLREGPTREELERARTAIVSGFVRSLERVGGFGGKAATLAACQTYENDPACFKKSLAILAAATPAAVQATGQRWLTRGDYTLWVKPFPAYRTTKTAVDRTKTPATATYPNLDFPALQRAKLANGIPVVLIERHDVPLVHAKLLFDAGYAADQVFAEGRKLGAAAMTLAMLDEGTESRGALQLAGEIEALGASIGASAGLDMAEIGMSALKARLAPTLDLWADVTLHPAFDPKEFARVQAQWLAAIAQEKTEPGTLALRILPPLLFGKGHAYGIPFTGRGTEASVRSLTPEDLREFHRTWLRSDNATLLVAGDTTLAEIVPLLDARFGAWRAPGTTRPAKNVTPVSLPPASRVFLIDKPGAEQSVILAGLLAPPSNVPEHLQITTMNDIIGGQFTARINQNLREQKHWSYGSYSQLPTALGTRPYLFSAPVETDHTAEAVRELLKELRGFIGAKPATAGEIRRVKDLRVRTLPGRYETGGAALSALTAIVANGWPDDYVQTLKARLEQQKDEDIRAQAKALIQPDRLTWVIVGDLARIEAAVRKLALGPIAVLDVDGNPVAR
jgi:zinc protease